MVLVFDLLAGILAVYGLDVLMSVFAVLLKAFAASVIIINFAHAYSVTNGGIDPATNIPYSTEAAQAFGNILPVTNAGSATVSMPPVLGQENTAGNLALFLGQDPQNSGMDQLTIDYAFQLPLGIPSWNGGAWTTVTPQPIQLYYTLEFYQEW